MISDGAAEAVKEDNAMSVFFIDFDMAPSVIWARDLYDQMQIQSDFRKWFPRMCQYGFVEGRDYEFVPRVRPQDEGGRTVQRYVRLPDHAGDGEAVVQAPSLSQEWLLPQLRRTALYGNGSLDAGNH